MPTVKASNPWGMGRCGPYDSHIGCLVALCSMAQQSAHLFSLALAGVLIGVLVHHVYQSAERGGAILSPILHLLPVERGVTLPGRCLNDVMPGVVCLDDYPSRARSTAGTPRHLAQ